MEIKRKTIVLYPQINERVKSNASKETVIYIYIDVSPPNVTS